MKTPPSLPKRCFPRYGIKFLIAAVTIVCVGLAVLGHAARKTRREQAAFVYLENAGAVFVCGDLDFETRTWWPAPQWTYFFGRPPPAESAWVRSCVGPDAVELPHTVVLTGATDADLRRVAELSNPKCLHCYDSTITDKGMSLLAGLRDLQSVVFDSPNITGAGGKPRCLKTCKDPQQSDVLTDWIGVHQITE